MNRPSNMPRQLKQYINTFLHAAELYRILAKSAPNDQSQKTLENFSEECRKSADGFSAAYRSMTGYTSDPKPMPIKETGSFRSVLRGRIPAEIDLSKRLREDYLSCGDNFRLKRTFFNAYHDALARTVSLIEMLM
ncbi:MAG: hypothetical protein IJ861_03665 [Clostridia bacterium]|nr:hypothetical protein [Clostridia bacterium]